MLSQVSQVVDEVFPTYDRDGSGSLDVRELTGFLTQALKRLGVNANVTDQQAESALKVIDKNSDKSINKAEATEALKSILLYKQQKGGMQPNVSPTTINPGGNNSYAQPSPSQNNGWGQQPQQNNNWGQPQQSNWGQPPPQQPNYGNSWAPGQNYNNNWQQQPQHNNWNQPPPSNNSWAPQQPNSYQSNNNQGWNQPQPNSWNQQPSWNSGNDWGSTSFTSQQDMEVKQLIDQLYLRYDSDRSGGLDRREMTRALNELFVEYGVSIRVSERQAGRLMQAIDNSGDGKIQKPQFFRMVKMIMSEGSDDY